MIEHKTYVVFLKPEKIAEYEQMHAEIPKANQENMRLSGIQALRIYRQGEMLIMTITRDLSVTPAPGSLDAEAEGSWQRLAGECFARPWQEFPQIFNFETGL